MSTFKSYVKKGKANAWKAVKRYTGNRYGRGPAQILSKGVPQMVKDINLLKSIINSEKLRTSTTSGLTPIPVSQVNVNNNAYHVTDITPIPTQGDGVNNRTGSSLRLHSSSISLQLYQQSAAISQMKFKIYIVQVIGYTVNSTNFMLQFLESNPFNNTIDYNSARHPDYFKNYKVLRVKNVTISPDSLSGAVSMKEIRIGLKYKNHHIRYDKNTTNITSGQIYMLIVADSGNQNGTSPSTLNVPVTAINTGGLVNYHYEHYYYDN